MAAEREDLEAKGIVPSDYETFCWDSLDDQFSQMIHTNSTRNLSQQMKKLSGLLLEGCLLSSSLTEAHCRSVLDLLAEFPDLAKAKVGPEWNSGCPLLHMAGAYGVRLEIIQGIYSLHEGAISEAGGPSSCLPLHRACTHAASEEVIKFLLAKYPEGASFQAEDDGCLPIHYAVQKFKTSAATLAALMDAYPECIHVKDKTGNTFFDVAFNTSCSPSMLQFLSENIPKIEHLNIALDGHPDLYRVDPSLLKTCLALYMPRVQQVKCRLFQDKGWERSMEVMEHMQTGQLRSIEIVELNGELVFKNKEVFSNIIRVLDQNPRLRRLSIGLFLPQYARAPYDLPGGNKLFHYIRIACAPKVQALELKRFSFLDSGASLAKLLRSMSLAPNSNLKELALELVLVDQMNGEHHDWKMQGAWRECKLEKLSLINCHMRKGSLLTFLEEMPHMPKLRDLVISFKSLVAPDFDDEDEEEYSRFLSSVDDDAEPSFDDIETLDITESVVQILNQGRLRALTVEGARLNINGICRALTEQDGAGLVKYHVPSSLNGEANMSCLASHMANNDWPLADILFPEEEHDEVSIFLKKHRADIDYFSSINYFGRSILAEGSSKRDVELFIEKLEAIEAAKTSDKSRASVPVLYVLLRLAPFSWSTL